MKSGLRDYKLIITTAAIMAIELIFCNRAQSSQLIRVQSEEFSSGGSPNHQLIRQKIHMGIPPCPLCNCACVILITLNIFNTVDERGVLYAVSVQLIEKTSVDA